MLLNKISLPLGLPDDATRANLLKVMAFADDVNYGGQSMGMGVPRNYTISTRYLPEGVPLDYSSVFGLDNFGAALIRQDAKSINLTPLSQATINEGLIINETTFAASAVTYFTNSYLINVAGEDIRVGVSNFTQTVDNNPFSALTASGVLYYQIT